MFFLFLFVKIKKVSFRVVGGCKTFFLFFTLNRLY